MSLGGVVEVAFISAVATGAVGGFGFTVGRALNKSERRVRQDVSQDTQLALLEQRVTNLEREQGRTNAQRQALGEEVAALASWTDSHNRWHERRGTNGGSGGS